MAKKRNTLKSKYKYIDLYEGDKIGDILPTLKKDFRYLSGRKKSPATEGTPTSNIKKIKFKDKFKKLKYTKIIFHRDNKSITLKTKRGYFRFWK